MRAIQNATVTIKQAWAYQPPAIHTWFLASSLSLAVMFIALCIM